MPNRREFLGALGTVFLSVRPTVRQSDGVQQSEPVYDPGRAGRPREVTTAADNDAGIQAIEKSWKISHVGISTGGWRMIHSSRSKNGVYEEDVQQNENLKKSFVGARTFVAR